jgi:multiple sugar transport system substrate-binding protein
MILTGPWDIAPITQGGAGLEWTTSPPLKNKQQITYSAGISTSIPKAARNKEAAFELIGKLTSLPVELAATKEANMTMPRLSWAKHPDVANNPILQPFAQALPDAVEYFGDVGKVGSWAKVTDLFQTAYQNAIFKKAEPAAALKEFVTQANAELKKG